MTDKIKHIAAGILAAVIVALPAYLDSSNLFAGIWASLTAGAVAGTVKEWCDSNTEGNQFDWRDLGCTVAGAAVVALFIVAMHYARG